MKKNSELIAQHSALWLAVCALLFALRVPAEAQQQTKVSKIGWLSARGAANIGQETIVGMLRDLQERLVAALVALCGRSQAHVRRGAR